ncbi:MAG: hypothetical protein RR847_05515 [Bacilli bacterium]
MKKFILLCLTFILAINISIIAYADTPFNHDTDYENFIKYEESVLNSAANTPMPDGIAATQLEEDSTTNKASAASITPFFIRQSANSKVVQVYLKYTGTKPANAVKFTEMTIQNTSLVFQKTYGSLTPKVYNFNYASTSYNQYLGNVNIPTDVTKVRVQDSGLKAYYVGSGWNSFSNIIGEWKIQ